ncbi:MAG: LysM peptidoglycan-binding domain-containing protein [Demequina sp.]|uniref:LysM peptidoglycan-binding domain-containing protein n=1 Tax=Demequina sp. TaxID=2050685 RepID=UPI003A8B7A82
MRSTSALPPTTDSGDASSAPYLKARLGAASALLALPVIGVGLAVLAWKWWADAVTGLPSIDVVIVAAIATCGAIACAWLTLACLTIALSPAHLRHRVARGTPSALRRLVTIALGASAAAAVALPATADVHTGAGWVEPPAPSAGWVAAAAAPVPGRAALDVADAHRTTVLAGVALRAGGLNGESAAPHEAPAVASTAPQRSSPAPSSQAPTSQAPSPTVTVRTGDSLWTLTADALGTDDTAVVAASWPLLYEDNREAIGDDPSLIHPGTVLTLPPEWDR